MPSRTAVGSSHQSTASLGAGPAVGQAADTIPGGRGQALPAPVLEPPIRGCDPSVVVSGVFDGATVTIERRSGLVDVAGFDLGALRVHPLQAARRGRRPDHSTGGGRRVRAPADSLGSGHGRETGDRSTLPTSSRRSVPAQRSSGSPACGRGAIVHLAANQTVYDGSAPADQTWLDCRVPPLTTDPVSATQELCGVTSGPATPVTVDPHEDNVPAPQIVGPLFSCTGFREHYRGAPWRDAPGLCPDARGRCTHQQPGAHPHHEYRHGGRAAAQRRMEGLRAAVGVQRHERGLGRRTRRAAPKAGAGRRARPARRWRHRSRRPRSDHPVRSWRSTHAVATARSWNTSVPGVWTRSTP